MKLKKLLYPESRIYSESVILNENACHQLGFNTNQGRCDGFRRQIKLPCRIGGWLIPMYGAGRLESGNVREYEDAARFAVMAGYRRFVPALLEMAEWMLARGADVNFTDWPVVKAATLGRLRMMRLLVEHGVDINAEFGEPPRTPQAGTRGCRGRCASGRACWSR